MIYINNGMTYWTKDPVLLPGEVVLVGEKTLMLNVHPNGQVEYVKLSAAAFKPKAVTLPTATTITLEDGDEELAMEFTAALSGLVLVKTGPSR